MIRLVVLLLSACCLYAGLEAVKAEPNLEKRAELALTHADVEISDAKKAYDEGQLDAFRTSIEEVAQLAELTVETLDSTGKRARKSPKHFKRAEQRLLVLIRRVDSLEKDVRFDDRAAVEAVRKRVSAVHERILHDIMTKK